MAKLMMCPYDNSNEMLCRIFYFHVSSFSPCRVDLIRLLQELGCQMWNETCLFLQS
uniref:Uncharacterized protein n=1 Tax=Physcomitrium patens TaxID=3218 RepID=A0A7I3ZZG9_PHYPA